MTSILYVLKKSFEPNPLYFLSLNSDENKIKKKKLEVMAYTDYIVTSAVDIF